MTGFYGPMDQWRAELETVTKAGLLDLVEFLALLCNRSREATLRDVRESKRHGKYINSVKSYDAMKADPSKYFAAADRRRLSAKKAAKRRKAEHRAAAAAEVSR